MSGNFVLSGFSGLLGLNKLHDIRFEDLINRRGWVPVLWEKSIKCPCYSDDTGNPDPKCSVCGGIGYTYYEDLDMDVFNEQLDITSDGQTSYVLKCTLAGSFDSTRAVSKVSRIWNQTQNISYTVSIVTGTPRINISGPTLPIQGDIVMVDYTYSRDPGASVKAVITNVDYQKDYIPSGEWLQGDCILTVSGQFKMGFRDRIIIPQQVVRTDELKRRYDLTVKGLSLERLRYKSGIEIVSCHDLFRSFTLGTDFTMGPDQTIVWGLGARPLHNAFNIKYTGNATTALLVVTPTALTVTLVGQTDGSTSITVPFATYPLVKDVIAYVKTKAKYAIAAETQGTTPGIDNAERMTLSDPVPSTSIKNVAVVVKNEDKTQYTIEYMHYLSYSIYMKQGMVRRHDDGTVLPGKYWLRLWENTDLFSNKHGS
jgi:hypothetical protein